MSSESPPASNPDDSASSDPDFDVLADYLETLQSGRAEDRDRLLARHPHLASALDCLDVLENLAPTPDEIAADEIASDPSVPSGLAATLSDSSPSAASAELPDQLRDFGNYELLEEVGRGGMGVVFRARQKQLDRLVAIKMILASHLASEADVRRFYVEARAAAGIQHPNILRIHEIGQHNGQHFFAMEFVDGPSLTARLAKGPLDVEASAQLVARVARAVEHLHQHGIVHRDLKPSNILLDHDGEPYVTDFGLAKVFAADSDLTASGIIAGTPSYMAPEQAAGRSRDVGAAADVYSLGAILYELLTGRPPFREKNPLDTLVQVLEREPTLLRRLNPQVPRELELICLRCLAKQPDDRYASAADVADDLQRYLRGEPIEAKSPSPLERLWRWARREPALASRLATFAAFYLVQLANYHVFHVVDWSFHVAVSLILLVWALASIAYQRIMRQEDWALATQFAWGATDVLAVTVLLIMADGAASPLVVIYPMLVVGSGLWYRVRFVWFVTVCSMLSYGFLIWDYYVRRADVLQLKVTPVYYRHLNFEIMLLALGVVVAYQVYRVRALSRYYQRRRLP